MGRPPARSRSRGAPSRCPSRGHARPCTPGTHGAAALRTRGLSRAMRAAPRQADPTRPVLCRRGSSRLALQLKVKASAEPRSSRCAERQCTRHGRASESKEEREKATTATTISWEMRASRPLLEKTGRAECALCVGKTRRGRRSADPALLTGVPAPRLHVQCAGQGAPRSERRAKRSGLVVV